MSSGQPEIIFQEIVENSNYNILERDIDISQLIIPFSKVFKSYKPKDIYSGNEEIAFKERDLEYRMLLKQEFANCLKQL